MASDNVQEEGFKILLTVKETEHYIAVTGIVPGDKVPQYLIFNKDYDVLEFAHNVLAYVLEAMDDLETKLQEYLTKDRTETHVAMEKEAKSSLN